MSRHSLKRSKKKRGFHRETEEEIQLLRLLFEFPNNRVVVICLRGSVVSFAPYRVHTHTRGYQTWNALCGPPSRCLKRRGFFACSGLCARVETDGIGVVMILDGSDFFELWVWVTPCHAVVTIAARIFCSEIAFAFRKWL
jgi:hypothetical protein